MPIRFDKVEKRNGEKMIDLFKKNPDLLFLEREVIEQTGMPPGSFSSMWNVIPGVDRIRHGKKFHYGLATTVEKAKRSLERRSK